MEFENIKELLKLFDESSLSSLKLKNGEFSINFEKGRVEKEQDLCTNYIQTAPQIEQIVAPIQQNVKVEDKKLVGEQIKSPMVGTFYKSPSPESAPFLKVGDKVKKGSPICIIEAMKIMNEIEAEFDFKLLEVLVDDGQPVEFDMPLFLIERV